MRTSLLLAQEAWSSENLQAREPLRKTWGVETSVLTPSAPQAARGTSVSEQSFHCPRARRAALYKPSHGIKNTLQNDTDEVFLIKVRVVSTCRDVLL